MTRSSTAIICLLAIVVPQQALADVQVDLRDYLYTFAVPKGALGPWHVVKLDIEGTSGKSRILARFVSGNRDDPGNPSHGEYFRLEDAQTLSPCFVAVGGFGVGTGYQPMRTWTSEILGRPNAQFPVYVAAGMEFSSITPTVYQRIIAAGPTFKFGKFYGYARYYRPSVPGQSFVVAPSAAFDLGAKVTRWLDLTGVFNFGGEIGGDRTASQLPTSSGRYGPDVGGGARYLFAPHVGASILFERAWYRQAPSGAYARTESVLAVGLFLRE